MTLRPINRIIAAAALALTAVSTPLVNAQEVQEHPAWCRLYYNDGSHDDLIMLLYKKGSIIYKLNPRDLNRTQIGRNKYQAFYFYEPKIYKDAMSLYNGRKYKEAREAFAKCETMYKRIDTAPNNFASLAGFYKLECSRRLMDFARLGEDASNFRKEGLTRENHLQQIELYAFWEAVRLKDWPRLDRFAKDWRRKKITGSQRAQVSYCHAVALENLAKKDPGLMSKALNAYNMVLTADFSASHELVVAAANACLRIYAADPEVRHAMKVWGTDDEDPNSGGRARLLEANKMVKLYKLAGLDKTTPLKAIYKPFEKFEDKEEGE